MIIITKNFISFIRGVFTAWPNIHDEVNKFKYKLVLFSTSFRKFVSVSF